MNVLHVLDGWPVSGGITQIYNHITHSRHNHMTLGNGLYGLSAVDKLVKAGIDCVLGDLEYSNIMRVVEKNNIGVVHKQTGGGDCPAYVDVLYKAGIPLVETLHCPRKSAIPIEKVMRTHAHFPYTASLNVDRVVDVIPFPIDFSIGFYRTTHWPEKKMVIGRLARYEPSKMQHFIVDLARYMRDNYPQYACNMLFRIGGFANTPFEKNYLDQLKRCQISGYLEIVDFVEEKDKEAFIAEYDLYINPTQNEGNYSFFEPLAKGTPVISNPTDMTKDLFVSAWADLTVQAFAEVIIKYYLDKQLYEATSQNCIDKFIDMDFSIENHVKRMDTLYEQN